MFREPGQDPMAPESFENVEMTKEPKPSHQTRILWRMVFAYIFLHVSAFYGIYLAIASCMWQTNIFAIFMYIFSALGITAGAHRLWAHRSYKAKLPLRIALTIMNTMAFEKDIYDWARDHRVHHKFTETDADPYNAKRGFFFSHLGWLMVKKHPEVLEKGKTVDVSDVLADPVVKFQREHYVPLVLLFWFLLPTATPMVLWGESFKNAFFVATMFRYVIVMNQSWLVNSAAHMWGNRPYDKHIGPRDNFWVIFYYNGEGFHNYHHTFPWDYAASEYGIKYNGTTLFINVMARIGQAYDLKTASPEVVKARKTKSGDGSLQLGEREKSLSD